MSDGTAKSGTALLRVLAFLWRPPVAFYGTIVAIGLYFLSIGPACALFGDARPPHVAAFVLGYLYGPLVWATGDSKEAGNSIEGYIELWFDGGIHWAFPGKPPFFAEVAGTLMVTWLVWHIIRWANYRKPVSLPPS
jgi:hypothetical protein